MTKFIDSTKEKVEKVKKKTVFKKYLEINGLKLDTVAAQPEDFDVVELIRRRSKIHKFDLFAAYDEGYRGNNECWYLGDAGDEFE